MKRIDEIGFGKLKLAQEPEEFCYGIDAVMLADFAIKMSKPFDKAIDLGTGTGIIPLILSHRTGAKTIDGIEVQENSFKLAEENVEMNDLAGRVSFININVKDVKAKLADRFESYDLVTTNPPYTKGGGGIQNDNMAKTIARHETLANLEDFVKAASFLLKDRGDFVMVHRPSRLVDICYLCRKYRLEPKEIQMVSAKNGQAPNIMLCHCVKNAGQELKVLEPLAVYDEEGYSQEIKKMY